MVEETLASMHQCKAASQAGHSEKPLRLVFFSHSAWLAGAERSLLSLVADLVRYHGAICTVILPEHGPLEPLLRDNGANVAVKPFSWWCGSGPAAETIAATLAAEVPSFFSDIVPFVREIDPDLIVTQTVTIPWGAAAAAVLGKPHIWSICEYGELDHGLIFIESFGRIVSDIENSSNFVFFAVHDIRNVLYSNLPEDRCDVLYRHIDIARSGKTDHEVKSNALRPVIGLFGTLSPSKGQADAIDAVAKLSTRGLLVELVLAGTETGEYADELRRRSQESGVRELVQFAGFFEDPYPAMQRCDILLVCSKREAFGRVAAEAMLMGKPLVYADSGGPAEFIENGKTGLSYPPGDAEGLAERIETLIHDRALGERLGQAAKDFARATFTRENYSGKFYKRASILRHAPGKISSFPRSLLTVVQWTVELQLSENKKLQQELSGACERLTTAQSAAQTQRTELARLAQELAEARADARLQFEANQAERARERESWERQSEERRALKEAHAAELSQARTTLEQQLGLERAALEKARLKAANEYSALSGELRVQSEKHLRALARLTRADYDGSLPAQLRSLRRRIIGRGKYRHLMRDYRALAASPLFDAEWYLANNPDVAAAKADPALHYLRYGGKEGRAPGPHFDGRAYLQANGDVAAVGVNPLLHYVSHGSREGGRLQSCGLQSERLQDGNAVTSEPAAGRQKPHFALLSSSSERPRVLMIDSQWPDPRRDSGSVDTLNYARWFKKLGCAVFFASDSEHHLDKSHGRYLSELGVNFCTSDDVPSIEELLTMSADAFDLFCLFRVWSGGRYLEKLQRLRPEVPIIFFTVDLHHVREERQARLNKDRNALMVAARTRERELHIIRNADVSIVVSDYEAEVLRSAAPGAQVAVMPLFREVREPRKGFLDRKGIGFVGGFRHNPNVDAVEYFLREVWPLIIESGHNFEFQIAGPDLPKGVRQNLPKRVRYLGQVDDLEAWLGDLRLTVAPLRFGAGAKGKVASSIANGVPVVGTGIAFEGMRIRNGYEVYSSNSPAEMAKHIIKLSTDIDEWSAMSSNCQIFAKKELSIDAGCNALKQVLGKVGLKVN